MTENFKNQFLHKSRKPHFFWNFSKNPFEIFQSNLEIHRYISSLNPRHSQLAIFIYKIFFHTHSLLLLYSWCVFIHLLLLRSFSALCDYTWKLLCVYSQMFSEQVNSHSFHSLVHTCRLKLTSSYSTKPQILILIDLEIICNNVDYK